MLQSKMICRAAVAVLATGFAGAYVAAAPIVMDIGASTGNSNSLTGTTTAGSISYNSVWTGSVANLVQTDGTATTVGFDWVDFSAIAYINTIDTGTYPITGAVAATFPISTAATWWGAPAGPMTFKFTGLNPATQYNFTLYAGHPLGTESSFYSMTGANTVSGSIVSGNNLSNLLAINGVTPTAGGEISVAASDPSGNGFAINAVQLEAVVPEPASLGLLGLAGLTMMRRRK